MYDPTDRIALMRPRLPAAPALRPYLEEIDRNRWYSNHGPLERRLVARLAGHFGLPEGGVTSVANGTVVEWQFNAVAACNAFFTDPPEPVDGWLEMPQEPGLGLTPDRDRIRDLRVDG